MKLPRRRQFLHLTAGATALPAVSGVRSDELAAQMRLINSDRSKSIPANLRADRCRSGPPTQTLEEQGASCSLYRAVVVS